MPGLSLGVSRKKGGGGGGGGVPFFGRSLNKDCRFWGYSGDPVLGNTHAWFSLLEGPVNPKP